jgi:tetratricopeptide (TPR) repeat protein
MGRYDMGCHVSGRWWQSVEIEMKGIHWFVVFLLITSCSSKQRVDEFPPITESFIRNSERSCESVTATRYETVEDLLRDFYANAKYKDSLELNLRLGTHYHFQGKYDTALFYYRKAEKIDTTDTELYFNIAKVYSDNADFERALESLDKGLKICGDRADFLNSKCYALGKLDRCEEAVAVGLVSKQLDPENIKIYGNLLSCFDKLNQADSVLKYIGFLDTKFHRTADWVEEIRAKYK